MRCPGCGVVEGEFHQDDCLVMARGLLTEALPLRHGGTGRILNQDEEGREVRGYAVDE